jgi:hypothetical protein
MGNLSRIAAVLLIALFSATAAVADDWAAVRLRGAVLQWVDGQWVKLHRGGIVPDSRVIRTLANGNVEFRRGEEMIILAPNSQMQIFDEHAARAFTTVKQYFGTVTVEAEVQNVEHFAVETPYLAAVVKGTRFVVVSDDDGASVEVRRGHVAVETSAHQSVTIGVGQSASVGSDGDAQDELTVAGRGKLPDVANAKAGKSANNSSGGSGKGTSDDKSNSGKSGKSGKGNSGKGNSGKDKGKSSSNGSNG